MIWGKTSKEKQKNFVKAKTVFLFLPKQLMDGRWAWLISVIRTHEFYYQGDDYHYVIIKKPFPLCTCGCSKNEHWHGEGACVQCACTWYHPEKDKTKKKSKQVHWFSA